MISFSLNVTYTPHRSVEQEVEQYNNSLMTEMAVAADIASSLYPYADSATVTQHTNGNYKISLLKNGKDYGQVEVLKKATRQIDPILPHKRSSPATTNDQFPHSEAFSKYSDVLYNKLYRHVATGKRCMVLSSSGVLVSDTNTDVVYTRLVTLVDEDGLMWHRPLAEFTDACYVRLP